MSALRQSAKALSIVLAAIAISFLSSLAVDRISFLDFYRERFSFQPGSWFAEAVSKVDSVNGCLVVGASTAREGIDAAILSERREFGSVINAATTGGNIEVLEIQAQILSRYGKHLKCVIAGVHPWLLFENDPPRVVSTGYLAHLRLNDVLELTDHSTLMLEKWDAIRLSLIPLGKHAQRLNKLVRFWIYSLQTKWREKPLALKSFEFFPGELNAPGNSLYPAGTDLLADRPELIKSRLENEYPSYVFDKGPAETSFRRALEVFKSHASQVFIVIMPDTPLIETFNKKGIPAFNRVVFQASVKIIDCSKLSLANSFFLDETHLKPSGRQILSSAISRTLGREAGSLPVEGDCEVRN